LRRRQPANEALTIGDATQLGDEFGEGAIAAFVLFDHGEIVAFPNYLDKAVYRKYSLGSLLNFL